MKYIDIINNFQYVNVDGKASNYDIHDADKNELLVGIFVELEHGSDINKAASIALDHLFEKSNYYTQLIKAGIADEKKALELAKKYLNISDDNKPMTDNDLVNILTGQKPLNTKDYTNN